jgi:protein-tyrosine phosphatase
MIDIHTHILPGVDDGASDMEESIKILEKGRSEGIKTFVLTPHIRDNSDWNKINYIKETFISLNEECMGRGLDVKLILGAELFLTPDLPDRLKDNTIVTINGSGRYVLVELPFYQMPIYTDDVLFKLLMEEFIPIIAHLERYMYLNGKDEVIKKWVENGIIIQINTGSLNGQYGMRVKSFAKKLLKNDVVHLLGSDVHFFDPNYCFFSKAIEVASRITGKDKIVQMVETFPAMVVNLG